MDSQTGAGVAPPVVEIDVGSVNSTILPVDGVIEVPLSFSWTWYGQIYHSAWVSENGVLFFEGETGDPSGDCPGGNTWSGVAGLWQDWANVEFRMHTVGVYPYRAMVFDWEGEHASEGGDGHIQIWLSEGGGYPQVVIHHDDIEFGSTTVNFGATAVTESESFIWYRFIGHATQSGPCTINSLLGLGVKVHNQWQQPFVQMTFGCA